MNIIDYSWDFSKEEFSLDLDFFNEKDQEDKLWQARTGLNYDTLCGAIETIIFMSDKPVNLQKIKSTIDSDLPLRVVHESIAKLQEEYELKHHGIRLMEVAQGYQFRTKATYSKIIQKIFKVSSLQLSPTALEVMSIIAYKQPISKTSVESIRGVDSSHIIRALMDRRLVKIVGRSNEVGRPSLYGTTDEFLEVFNLNNVSELPSQHELEELATASNLASISEIKEVVQKGDSKRFDLDELDELDKLSDDIKSISSDTLFTKSLKLEEKRRNDTEGHQKKTAFEILEDYLNRTEIIEQNKLAAESETIMNVVEALVVNVTSSNELFNAPEVDEDISSIDERELPSFDKELEQSLDDNFDDSEISDIHLESDRVNEQVESLFEEDATIDVEKLADALDDAFDTIFSDQVDKEDIENANAIINSINNLKKSENEISEKGKELDLDLDFLNNLDDSDN